MQLAHYNLLQADLTLRAALVAGVTVAAGHDWHPFWDHALELRRMMAHGMTPTQALSAATAGAAYALGIGEYVGTVAPGKVADSSCSTATRSPSPRCSAAVTRSGWCCRAAPRSRAPRWSPRRPRTDASASVVVQ